MTHTEKAREYFLAGYNCAQSVCAAFCDVTGMSESEALKISASFGGGFGRLRQLCGAVSAMGLVLGAVSDYDVPDATVKSAHYARVQALAKAFDKENGSLSCIELLKGLSADTSPVSPPRTPEFYRVRPCIKFVESAARILDQALTEGLG